jgi:hypothetical protein
VAGGEDKRGAVKAARRYLFYETSAPAFTAADVLLIALIRL